MYTNKLMWQLCNRNWFNCKLNQLRCHCDISLLVYIKEVYKQTNDYNWDTNETYLGVYVLGLTNPAQVHPHSLGVLQALEQLLNSSLADDAWFPHLLCAHIYFCFLGERATQRERGQQPIRATSILTSSRTGSHTGTSKHTHTAPLRVADTLTLAMQR